MNGRTIISIVAALCAACAPATNDPTRRQDAETALAPRAQHLIERSLPEIAAALKDREASSEELVHAYLDRIERIDRNGPTLQSVLSLNPNALAEAREKDSQRAAGGALGPLHGVPILIKDNIETRDFIATTAGALALEANVTGRDAPAAAGLRAAGAIILGKTNLSQWANFRSDYSISGWSAIGGQVKNPHMLDRSPCGSSSGSGAAVAASLAAGAVGTETNGSIICPSQVNGVVGFKPSVGLVSQQYIVPISSSQDTAGPMTKTVAGAAVMLTAMAEGDVDYLAALDENALDGARVGVLRFSLGGNPAVTERFDEALTVLENAGAELVEIKRFEPDAENFRELSYDLLLFEFKTTLDAYLADAAPDVQVRSLEALIDFNRKNRDIEMAIFGQEIFEEAAKKGGLDDPDYLAARDTVQRATRENGIDALLDDCDCDVLVAPSGPIASRIDAVNGDVWPKWEGAGYLAAMAGYPHATVPMEPVQEIPLGISFMGGFRDDARVLSFAYAYEQRTHWRKDPSFVEQAEDLPEIAAALARK